MKLSGTPLVAGGVRGGDEDEVGEGIIFHTCSYLDVCGNFVLNRPIFNHVFTNSAETFIFTFRSI